MKKLKTHILNFAKQHHWFMSFIRIVRSTFNRILYFFLMIFYKTENDMILFDSFMGRQYSDSPKAIYLELLKDHKYRNYKFIWAFKNPEKYYDMKSRNTIIVKYNSKDYYKYVSKSKYWITNSRINERIIKKNNQIYVQCWHGTPLKKLGFDLVKNNNAMNNLNDIRKKYKIDSLKYNYMISPSKFCTEKFISCFDLENPNIVLETGYPRNDILYNYTKKDVTRIKNKLNIKERKKIILYAPTWRDNQHESGIGYTYKLGLNFDNLYKEFKDKYIILFRTHYFVSNLIDLSKYKDFVINVSDYDDINDLYIISDYLITDYSSVFFDYANLKRPILFYMYDFDEYKNKLRDFYIDLEELPGKIVIDESSLIKEIKNLEKNKYDDKYKKFNDKYNYLDDGKASKRVIKEVIK